MFDQPLCPFLNTPAGYFPKDIDQLNEIA